MKIADIFNLFEKCTGVSIDSRSIQSGQMFFALTGPNFDGHEYISNAFESGAKYAIIDNKEYDTAPNTIVVDNVEKTLQDLARYYRSTLTIPVIGLTGSNGKTTTKELIACVLSESFHVFATKGNLNNHLGVPISILSIRKHHTIAIIEMGANHQKEIEFLSGISMPDFGLITNIGKAHLEGFGNIEGVRRGKTELYDYIRKVKGLIFYNSADPLLKTSITDHDNVIEYTTDDVFIESSFPSVSIVYDGVHFRSNISGGYNAANILAAITVGRHFKLSDTLIANGLKKYSPHNNRSEIKKTAKNTLILDAYNANPTSMKASIENLYNADVKNKVLIVGHMLELGHTSKSEHQDLVNYIEDKDFSTVYLIGSEFKDVKIPTTYNFMLTTELLTEDLKKNIITNSTVLLKGSRGIALEKVISYL